MYNSFKIGSFFKSKDVHPECMRTSVIYNYSCAHCASEYIGSTLRTFSKRVCEHKGISVRTGRVSASPPYSAVRDHAIKCKTSVTNSGFTILDQCNRSPSALRVLESLHIYTCKPRINDSVTSFPLNLI